MKNGLKKDVREKNKKLHLQSTSFVSESFESKWSLSVLELDMFQYEFSQDVFSPYPALAQCHLLLWSCTLRFP